MPEVIQEAYNALLARWGRQQWWPAQSRLEMMIGAILTQNTAWSNVEKAMANLREHDALDFHTLEKTSARQIREWIRPAGYFNQKTIYIRNMIQVIRERFDESLDRLFALDTPTLRTELLSWKGIGPETADSILLYAGERPVFVVDAYTRRMSLRHEWIDENAGYDALSELFAGSLPTDVQCFNEYHALIVKLGKTHCKTRPECSGCPLEKFLSRPVSV